MDTINFLVQLKKIFFQFYDSNFFFGFKIILAVYVAVLTVDIILIIIVHTPGMYLRVLRSGANVPAARKNKMQKRWDKVMARLENEKEAQYKLAVLEADAIVDEILSKVGYVGSNMGERLAGINRNQLEMIEELRAAHEVRNEIVHRVDFPLEKGKAQEFLGTYQKTLETLEFI